MFEKQFEDDRGHGRLIFRGFQNLTNAIHHEMKIVNFFRLYE